jgi:hypothetical protein
MTMSVKKPGSVTVTWRSATVHNDARTRQEALHHIGTSARG